jgi:hypothetical protein
MNLCTVTNEAFHRHALNLMLSFRQYVTTETIYFYHFNCSDSALDLIRENVSNIEFTEVPQLCDHAHNPLVFFYKCFALNNCLPRCASHMVYADASHCFVKSPKRLVEELESDCFFLQYPYENLKNKYWTTRLCFEKTEGLDAMEKPQYWAGFQAYKKTAKNINFVNEIFNYMLDPEVALPTMRVPFPDGLHSSCMEHRCDQSVLSILIDKHDLHQDFCPSKTQRYGDWRTLQAYNPLYGYDKSEMILSPRESKFGLFRYLF